VVEGVDDGKQFPDLLSESDSIIFPFTEKDSVFNFSDEKKNLVNYLKKVKDQCEGVKTVHVLCDSNQPISFPNVNKDKENVVVSKSNKNGSRRVYDKKHVCLFCNNMYSKIARHMEQKHSKES